MLANELDQLRRGGALTHNLEAGAPEQPRETLTQEHVVFRQHHASRARRHTHDYGGHVELALDQHDE
jgi:hypothetical protein